MENKFVGLVPKEEWPANKLKAIRESKPKHLGREFLTLDGKTLQPIPWVKSTTWDTLRDLIYSREQTEEYMRAYANSVFTKR